MIRSSDEIIITPTDNTEVGIHNLSYWQCVRIQKYTFVEFPHPPTPFKFNPAEVPGEEL